MSSSRFAPVIANRLLKFLAKVESIYQIQSVADSNFTQQDFNKKRSNFGQLGLHFNEKRLNFIQQVEILFKNVQISFSKVDILKKNI